MKLKGKDYLQVAWRLVWFREEHPDWGLDTSMLHYDPEARHAIFKATICDESGAQKSSGYGSESAKDFGDFIEKAETKAVGRALAMLGYGTQFCADEMDAGKPDPDEFDEGHRIVDTPIDRKPAKAKPTKVTKEHLIRLRAICTLERLSRICSQMGVNRPEDLPDDRVMDYINRYLDKEAEQNGATSTGTPLPPADRTGLITQEQVKQILILLPDRELQRNMLEDYNLRSLSDMDEELAAKVIRKLERERDEMQGQTA